MTDRIQPASTDAAPNVSIHIGAQVNESFSGYTLTARMPDGQLIFQGPKFIEGKGQELSKVKLTALLNFLGTNGDRLSAYGEDLQLTFWSNDDELARVWKEAVEAGFNFKGTRHVRLWNSIAADLSRDRLRMNILGCN